MSETAESAPTASDDSTEIRTDRVAAEPSFLSLRPLSMARISRALDAVGYEVLKDAPTTVAAPDFDLFGSVQGGDKPVLALRFRLRRGHPVTAYGSLLSIANQVNMSLLVGKAHVRIDSREILDAANGPDAEAPKRLAPFCVFVIEAEVPAATGIADVQIYDAITYSARVVESVISNNRILAMEPKAPSAAVGSPDSEA
jgi:hypothetical protein